MKNLIIYKGDEKMDAYQNSRQIILQINNKIAKLNTRLDRVNSLISETILINGKLPYKDEINNVKNKFSEIRSEILNDVLPIVDFKISKN